MVSFVVGIVFTWMFLYGLTPALQGYASVAMGGLDLSWLAGGPSAAAPYAVIGRGVTAVRRGVRQRRGVTVPGHAPCGPHSARSSAES